MSPRWSEKGVWDLQDIAGDTRKKSSAIHFSGDLATDALPSDVQPRPTSTNWERTLDWTRRNFRQPWWTRRRGGSESCKSEQARPDDDDDRWGCRVVGLSGLENTILPSFSPYTALPCSLSHIASPTGILCTITCRLLSYNVKNSDISRNSNTSNWRERA